MGSIELVSALEDISRELRDIKCELARCTKRIESIDKNLREARMKWEGSEENKSYSCLLSSTNREYFAGREQADEDDLK